MGQVLDIFYHSKSPEKIAMENSSKKSDEMKRRLDFLFAEECLDDEINGLFFNEIHVPEEIIILILSFLPITDLLNVRLVCKRWYNLVKLHTLWSTIYFRRYRKHPKQLPWFLFYALFGTEYFSNNLLENNCGQKKFENWIILSDGGNKFKVEKDPKGSEPLPSSCIEFQNNKSCFATSFGWCIKAQLIHLNSNLINFIVNKYKPTIYISDWVAGRFDCGGHYILKAKLYSSQYGENPTLDAEDDESQQSSGILVEKINEFRYTGGEATAWRNLNMRLENYPEGVNGILFQHGGVDNQFWRGHYGPKMSGSVVKILFDSIEHKGKKN